MTVDESVDEETVVDDDVTAGDAPADDDVAADGAAGEAGVPTATAVLEYLTRALVAEPDSVQVEVDADDAITLNITVADGDMGRVIGKRGRVANAIRVVGRAAAAKDGETGVSIEFVD